MAAFAYDAVVAKCRCLEGQLLGQEEYSALLRCRSVGDAAACLASFPAYSAPLARIDLGAISRGRLEFLLDRHYFDMYVKLYQFMYGDARRLFRLLIADFEIHYLLCAIRAAELPGASAMYTVPVFLSEHSDLDYGALFSAAGHAEILAALEGSPYAALLAPYLTGEEPYDFSKIETVLHCAYYGELQKKNAALLDRRSAENMRAVVSMRIDFKNLSRIIRLKRFSAMGGMPADNLDQVRPYLITPMGRLREEQFGRMLRLSTAEEIISSCAEGLSIQSYRRIGRSDAEAFHAALAHITARKTRTSLPSMAVPYSYLMRKRAELDNIIYIIEAIRYGIPPSVIEQNVILGG